MKSRLKNWIPERWRVWTIIFQSILLLSKNVVFQTYQYECMCASSYPIFDEIFSHNIGKDKDGYPNELKDVWITLNFFWSIFRIAHTKRGIGKD